MKDKGAEENLSHNQILVEIKERSDTELKTATKRVSIADIMAQYKSKATNAEHYKTKSGSDDQSSTIPDLPTSGSSSRNSSQDEDDAIMNTIERVSMVNGKRRNSIFGAAGKSAGRLLKGAASSTAATKSFKAARRASQPEMSTNLDDFLAQQAKECEDKYKARIDALEEANAEMMEKLNASSSQLDASGNISTELSGLVDAQATEMQKVIDLCEQQKERINNLEKSKMEIEVVAQKRRVSLQEQKIKLESVKGEVTQLKRDRKSLRKQLKEKQTQVVDKAPSSMATNNRKNKIDEGPPPLLSRESMVLLESYQDQAKTSKSGEESLEEICQRQKNQLELLQLDKEMVEEALANTEQEKQELEKALEEHKREAYRADDASIQQQQEQLDQVDLAFKAKMDKQKNQIHKLELQVTQQTSKAEHFESVCKQQVSTIEAMEDAIGDQTTDMENLEHDKQSLQAELNALKDKIDLQSTEIHSLVADKSLFAKELSKLDTAKVTVEAQLAEIVALQTENETLTKKLWVATKAQSREDNLRKVLESKAAELEQLQAEKAKLEVIIAELQNFKRQGDSQKVQIEELKQDKDQLEINTLQLKEKVAELQGYQSQVESQKDDLEWLIDEKKDFQRQITKLEESITELQIVVDDKTMQMGKYEEAFKHQDDQIEALQRAKDEADLARKMQSDEISKLNLEMITIRKLERQKRASEPTVDVSDKSDINVEEHITQLATLMESKNKAAAELSQLRDTVKKQAAAIEDYERKFIDLTSLVQQKQDVRDDAFHGAAPVDDIMSFQTYDYDESTLGDETATWDGQIGTKSHSLATGTMWFPEGSDDEDDWNSTHNYDDDEAPSTPDAQNDSMLNIVDVFSLGTGVLRSQKVIKETSTDDASNVAKSTSLCKGTTREEIATPQVSNTSTTRSVQGTPPDVPFPVPPTRSGN